MKKVFVIEDLDCAHCAAKMEEAIKKIDGVNSATVTFFTQKLTLDASDDKFDKVVKEAQKAIKKVDPACKLIEKV
ncbi:MAG: heavy-metal-associated domain-containing protein [Ruminococcaceae bacterium]|nr:heavy-metal-associated domain-containing protein [Oscillospiraceae bacterium]